MCPYRRTFVVVVVVALCVKLWLLSGIRTVGYFAPHDASNFVVHAAWIASGHWFGPYDGMTLIKQPFYPLYLAFVQETGMTLTVANIFLDLLTAVAVVAALAPAFTRPFAPCLLFLVIFFQPISYDGLAWTTDRSTINPDLAVLVLASAIGLYARRGATSSRQLRWSVGLGASLAAFWLNREDAIWIVPGLLAIAAAYVLWTIRRRAISIARLALLAIPPLACGAAIAAIMLVNGRLYGWAVTNEQQSPEFVSAYNSLTRIDVPVKPYLPLPKAARLLAYAASPAARELAPTIEGADGAGWVGTTCATTPELCASHDIGGGWAEWAVRDGVMNAGHYDSGEHARAYYTRLAAEIDTACASGRLRCRPKGASVFPPPLTADAPARIAASLRVGAGELRTLYGIAPGEPAAPTISSSLRLDYDFVARSVSDAGIHVFDGWILYNHARRLTVVGPGSSDAQLVMQASPDVAVSFANLPGYTLDEKRLARFHLATECDEACALIAENHKGEMISVPLRDNRPSVAISGISMHLDDGVNRNQFDSWLKRGALTRATHFFRAVFTIALPLTIALLLVRFARSALKHRLCLPADALFSSAAILSCAAYLVLLSAIDALSFRLFSGTYIATVYVVMIVACAVTVVAEGSRVWRLIRRLTFRRRSQRAA